MFCLICLLLTLSAEINCIQLLSMVVPNIVKAGKDVQLICTYSLDNDTLYSLKWHLNNREFYQYVPRNKPQIQVFPIKGIRVDLNKSQDGTVTLNNIDHNGSGTYKCEISAEGTFLTILEKKVMKVCSYSRKSILEDGKERIIALLLDMVIIFIYNAAYIKL